MVPAAAAARAPTPQSSTSAVDAATEPAAVPAGPAAVSASLCQVRRPWLGRADQLLHGQRAEPVYVRLHELHQAKRVPLAVPRRLPARMGLSA